MLFSRRNLLLLGLLLTANAVSAQAPVTAPQSPATAPQFRLTVWTIRPVLKKLPTFEELRGPAGPWSYVQGFDKDQIRIASDPKILEALQKANPLFSIPRFEQKKVVTVPMDTPTEAVLASGAAVKIIIKGKDREATYTEIAQAKGKETADLYRHLPAQEMILLEDIRVPHLDDAFHPTEQMSRSRGYNTAKPNLIYSTDLALAYHATLVRAGENGMPSEYRTYQEPKDIVLYCLEPLPIKGEQK